MISHERKETDSRRTHKRLPSLALEVLDVLSLIKNQIVPLLPFEGECILHR